jgi:hypothetical protein
MLLSKMWCSTQVPLADESDTEPQEYELDMKSGYPIVTHTSSKKRRRLHREVSGGADDWKIEKDEQDRWVVVPVLI